MRQDVKQVKQEAEGRLLGIPGVTGVAIGRKKSKGVDTGDISIQVYVEKKRAKEQIPPDQLIPSEIDGIKTDVVETGPIRLLAESGGSTLQSEHSSGSGTLGCFAFTDETAPKAVLVTNQHVAFSHQDVTPLGGEVGSVVCSICSPCCSKILGHVSKVVLNAHLDGAVALLKPGVQIVPEVRDIGVVNGIHPITDAESDSGAFVVKMYSRIQGRVVTGTVSSINSSGAVNLHDGTLHRNFQDQISITSGTAFALPGDSGSAVFDSSNNIVGLLFGGNDPGTLSLACPVAQVEGLLQVKIAKGTAAGQVFTVPAASGTPTAGEPVAMPVEAEFRSPRREKLRQAHARVLATSRGRRFEAFYHKHVEEVRNLVNRNKRVATVWHRNQGPAFLIHFSNSLMDEQYAIPALVKEISLQDLGRNMASILMKFGSEALQGDLREHGAEVMALSAGCRRAEDVLGRLQDQEEACLAT